MSDAFELVWICHPRFSSQIFNVCGIPNQFPPPLGTLTERCTSGKEGTVRRKSQPCSGAIVSSAFTVLFMTFSEIAFQMSGDFRVFTHIINQDINSLKEINREPRFVCLPLLLTLQQVCQELSRRLSNMFSCRTKMASGPFTEMTKSSDLIGLMKPVRLNLWDFGDTFRPGTTRLGPIH
jgi:hypothetical protein